MYKIIWSDRAISNLKDIHKFTAQDSIEQGNKVVYQIIEKAETLLDFPLMGKHVPERPKSSLRQLVVYPYRIIYLVRKNAINIVAVIHGKQQFSAVYRKQ